MIYCSAIQYYEQDTDTIFTLNTFVSRDVIFHETIFPFKTMSSIPSTPTFSDNSSSPMSWDPDYFQQSLYSYTHSHHPTQNTDIFIPDSVTLDPNVTIHDSFAQLPSSLSNTFNTQLVSSLYPPLRQSTRTRTTPTWLKDYDVPAKTPLSKD